MINKNREDFLELLTKMLDKTGHSFLHSTRMSQQELEQLPKEYIDYYVKTFGEQFTVRYQDEISVIDSNMFDSQDKYIYHIAEQSKHISLSA